MANHDVIIIGGGLAGLTAGIHLAQRGLKIAIFEKEEFPHHKVCGEYLSREVLPYLEHLDVPVFDLKPKEIEKLQFSTVTGNDLEVELPLGALGVSRFALDHLLYRKALEKGVEVIKEKVSKTAFLEDDFEVSTSQKSYTAKYVFGAFGKRSLLDRDRAFFAKPAPWVAVKSHFQNDFFPDDLVALHNFKGGYCGLSRTESEAINVCYLATYESFKEHKDPEVFQEKVLRKNPLLNSFFGQSKQLFEKPLTIAQVSFSSKKAVHDHMLMLGDSAGLIHPVCGNGMAMAIHSAKIASEALLQHLEKATSRANMEKEYIEKWESNFSRRMQTGRWLQKVLLNDSIAGISQAVVSKMPFLLPKIIKQTHGKPIPLA